MYAPTQGSMTVFRTANLAASPSTLHDSLLSRRSLSMFRSVVCTLTLDLLPHQVWWLLARRVARCSLHARRCSLAVPCAVCKVAKDVLPSPCELTRPHAAWHAARGEARHGYRTLYYISYSGDVISDDTAQATASRLPQLYIQLCVTLELCPGIQLRRLEIASVCGVLAATAWRTAQTEPTDQPS